MTERVVNCLACNFAEFCRDQEIEAANLTVNLYPIFNRVRRRKFSAIACDDFCKVSLLQLLLGNIKEGHSAFRHYSVGIIKYFIKGLPGETIFRKLTRSCVKTQEKALHRLEECVVQIPGNIFS